LIRSWLCYSNSKGCVYCLVCKLFSVSQTSLRTSGYSNWVNLLRILDEHEESPDHKKINVNMVNTKGEQNCY